MERTIEYILNFPTEIGIGLLIVILVMIARGVSLQGDLWCCSNCLLIDILLGFFVGVFINAAQTIRPCCDDDCNNSICMQQAGDSICCAAAPTTIKPPMISILQEKLSRTEVEMVMNRLGIFCRNQSGVSEYEKEKLVSHQEKLLLDPKEIAGVFEEQEPSLDEVKEAFDVFDKNRDGYIDAADLRSVLCALGLEEVSERECRRLIKAFDENNDELIDFKEFTKLVEKSFS